MTNHAVASVEALRVMSIELAHTSGQIAIDSFDQQVVVIRHLAKRMYNPIETGTLWWSNLRGHLDRWKIHHQRNRQ